MATTKRNRLAPTKGKRTTTTRTRAKKATASKSKTAKKDIAERYNEMKQFEGHWYKGMAVGRSHKWYYDKGEWNEKKVAPDRWEFSYAVPKRRAGHAPPGSGVAVGTEYHWYLLAHQNVRKLDENTYSTALTGLKYKLAHKRADKDSWSASEQAQRRQLIRILQDTIEDLRKATPEGDPARRLAATQIQPKSRVRAKRASSLAGTRAARQRDSGRKRLVASAGRRRR